MSEKNLKKLQTLEEEHERLRYVCDIGTDGFWDWNLLTDEEYFSPSFKALFGYKDHELENHASTWQRLICPKDLIRAEEAFKAHIEKGKPYDLKVKYKHKNGSTVSVICRGVAIKNSEGEYVRMIGTHTDITKQMEAEEKTIQSNKELAHFIYAASHDLQEPIRMVSAYCSLIKQRYENCLDEKGIQFINHAVDGSIRMKSMIEGLLQYSRAGHWEVLETKPTSEILDIVFKNLSISLANNSPEIYIQKDLPDLDVAYIDAISIFQNLIHNSIKYKSSERTLEINITYTIEGKYVKFCISDNGIGVDEKYAKNIFLLFNTSNTNKGDGIGLSICKKIVQNYGTNIELLPSEVGATFCVTLPIKS